MLSVLSRAIAIALGLFGVAAAASAGNAASTRSDHSALSTIFAEQHAADSALAVHRRGLSLSDERRYEYLARWVLPGRDHARLRVAVDFAPLNPAPPVDLNRVESQTRNRINSGGAIVSPVVDLVSIAARLKKLDELLEQVARWDPGSEADAQIDRMAVLLLIDLARAPEIVAVQRLEDFLELAAVGRDAQAAPSAAEVLILDECMQHPNLRDIAADAVGRYRAWIVSEYARSPYKQHVAKLLGAAKTHHRQKVGERWTPISAAPLAQWAPVSRSTAASRGRGYPAARWDSRPGHVFNRGSHDDDYLYFAVPLRGSFEVECEVTPFGWEDSHLMVAGRWIAPVYSLDLYDTGHFRNQQPSVEVNPPLTRIHSWIHYRTTVRDLVATTYINGRKVHEEWLSAEHDPWVAIRSNPQCDGAVKNLRITGQPTVPQHICLSLDRRLNSWLPYFEDRRHDALPSMWEHAGSIPEGGEIRSITPAHAAGTTLTQTTSEETTNVLSAVGKGYRENLLRYHRPMLEDGTIRYDFYYRPGEFHVHPAIDRLAFLLDPRGVRIHWISDGRFDRTGLDPANVQHESDRPSRGALPLKPNAWNEIELRLVGDVVNLVLNGERIYERRVEPTNQRTFGLFHYADLTTARVRNVVWEGDWQRQLPPLQEQELFLDETGFLDRRAADLPATFSHDFAAGGLPASKFAVFQGEPGVDVRAAPEGLYATRQGNDGFQHASVAPVLTVGGDFDITAAFDNFQAHPQVNKAACKAWLGVGTPARDQALLLRWRNVPEEDQQIVQCVRNRLIEGEFQSTYFSYRPAESLSGKLRLARRGTDIYYLFAENDSDHFQIIGQETFPVDDLGDRGVELTVQTHGEGGSTSVVWKNLTIRAERLSGLALEDTTDLLATLNRQRAGLPEVLVHDFTRKAPDPALFTRWTDAQNWNADEGGLKIVHPGTDQWTSAGASLLKSITGDFDISVQFDDIDLADPIEASESALYLQVELADDARTQVEAKISNGPTTGLMAVAQRRDPDGSGGYSYPQVATVSVKTPHGLRIARRGDHVYYLVTADNLEGETIITRTDVGSAPVDLSNIRFVIHTGGAGRTSRVLWKRIEVHADQLDPKPVQARPNDTPARMFEKAILQSISDWFKSRCSGNGTESTTTDHARGHACCSR